VDFQVVGSIGELIGGIAVVPSVIYLTVQIRHGITGDQSSTLLQWEAYHPRRIIPASFREYTGIREWWSSEGKAQVTPDLAMDIDKAIKDFNIELPEIRKELFSK
jgi:hypothetical protein